MSLDTGKNSQGATKIYLQKRKREKFIRRVKCQICGDVANDHIHYGALACYSCRAFFRRCRAKIKLKGVNHNGICDIDIYTRTLCPHCRYQKCLAVGMKPQWVMTEKDKQERKEKLALKRKDETNYEKRMR